MSGAAINAERLLAHYERIADAPDAITRLRRFILELAVRGKLMPQDPRDEPASETLKCRGVAAVKAGTFALPPAWNWVNVGAVAETRLGKMLDKSKNKGQPRRYLRNVNVRWFDFDLSDLLEMRFQDAELPEFALRTGDVLICEGGEPGRAAVWDGRADDIYFQKAIHRVRFSDFVDSHYFVRTLRASANDGRLAEYFTGTGIKHFTGKGLDNYLFPLPPLAEQRRIVAKVDELMALCDDLEAARGAREATRDGLATASLARLNEPNPETFQADARFALSALPSLSARPDQINQLRQTILNLAVRGRLVPQDPKDEVALMLVKRIDSEVQQTRQGPYGESPLKNLPESWMGTRLGRLTMSSDAGWSPKTENHPRTAEEWGVLKVSAVSWDEFREDENKQVLPGTKPRLQAQVMRGDFLISRANTAALVGRAVIVEHQPVNLMMSDKIVRLKLTRFCNHHFVLMVNNYADFAREHYALHASGVSPSMKNVSRDVIMDLPIPLPPLAEQHRIVAKVDELMALCDQLEASLTSADATRSRLLGSLLHEALAPTSPAVDAAAE